MEAEEASGGDTAGETHTEALAVTRPQAEELEKEREDGAGNEDLGAGAGARNSGAESERSAGEASPGAPPDTHTDVDPAGSAAPDGEISDSQRQNVDDGGKEGESERGEAAGEEGMQAEEARGNRDKKEEGDSRTLLAAAVEKSEPNEVENADLGRACRGSHFLDWPRLCAL